MRYVAQTTKAMMNKESNDTILPLTFLVGLGVGATQLGSTTHRPGYLGSHVNPGQQALGRSLPPPPTAAAPHC